MRTAITAMTAALLFSVLSLQAQESAQVPTAPTPDRSARVSDCRADYEQAMTSMGQMLARLDAADRSHDQAAIRSAIRDARQLLAGVKAKVAACTADTAATVTVDPARRDTVDLKTAPTATYDGKQYVFCSEADKVRFQRDPTRYISERARCAEESSNRFW